MTFEEKRVRLPISTDGWIRCPRCRKKIFHPNADTFGRNIPIPCFACKISWVTPIESREPNEAR